MLFTEGLREKVPFHTDLFVGDVNPNDKKISLELIKLIYLTTDMILMREAAIAYVFVQNPNRLVTGLNEMFADFGVPAGLKSNIAPGRPFLTADEHA
jgi:hypothetical protein